MLDNIINDVIKDIVYHIRDLTTYRNIRSTCKSFSKIDFTQKINIHTNELEATLKSVYSHIRFKYITYSARTDYIWKYNVYKLVIAYTKLDFPYRMHVPPQVKEMKIIHSHISSIYGNVILGKLKIYNSYINALDLKAKKVYYKENKQMIPFPKDTDIGEFSLYWFSRMTDLYSFFLQYECRNNIKEMYLPKDFNRNVLKNTTLMRHFVL